MIENKFDLAREHFNALAQPYALEVLFQLKDQAHSVHELAQALGVSGTQLNQVLTILRRARLIHLEKQGHFWVYAILPQHLQHLIPHIYQIYHR